MPDDNVLGIAKHVTKKCRSERNPNDRRHPEERELANLVRTRKQTRSPTNFGSDMPTCHAQRHGRCENRTNEVGSDVTNSDLRIETARNQNAIVTAG